MPRDPIPGVLRAAAKTDTVRIAMNDHTSPIRKYRTAQGLTAECVASWFGISEVTLRSYENGTRKIPPEFAVAFETRTGVPRHELRPDIFVAPPAKKEAAA
jgi:DNA-binding transcriptional regulator YdaS (Cro superfamily)